MSSRTPPPATGYDEIPLDKIREPAHRLRATIDPLALGELADSIAAEGLHQPIGVRGPDAGGGYEIVWGHRRYLAVQLLNRPSVTARVFPLSLDPLLAAVTENLQRSDLTPVEEAAAVARFVDRGQADAAIARLFRRSPSWVDGRKRLHALPDDLKAAVHDGRLSVAAAVALAEVDNPPYRASLVGEAERTGANASTVSLWVQHYHADKERIVSNYYTAVELNRNREAWKIMVPCQGCGRTVDYAETDSLRLCLPCLDDVRQAVALAGQETPPGSTGTPSGRGR